MNKVDFNTKVSNDIHANILVLNGVDISEVHPKHDFDWFTLDVSVLDGNDLLM